MGNGKSSKKKGKMVRCANEECYRFLSCNEKKYCKIHNSKLCKHKYPFEWNKDHEDPNNHYLFEHFYENDVCGEKKLDGCSFCEKHKCRVKGCKEQLFHKCISFGPNSKRLYQGTTMCKKHYCCVIVLIKGKRYQRLCPNQRIDSTQYCKEHTCGIHLCENPKYPSAKYCEDHTCDIRGCKRSVNHNFKYCRVHICRHASCPLTKTADSIYCKDHTCPHVGCQKAKGVKEMYCDDHSKPPNYNSISKEESTDSWSFTEDSS